MESHHQRGFLPKCILNLYKDDGDVIFFFSHFEEDNMGNLFAIYEFDTTVKLTENKTGR